MKAKPAPRPLDRLAMRLAASVREKIITHRLRRQFKDAAKRA